MEIKIIKNRKNELEIEVNSDDPTLLEALTSKVNENEGVEFAAYSWDHPLIARQRFYVRTKKEEPLKIIESSLKEIKKDLSFMKKELSK